MMANPRRMAPPMNLYPGPHETAVEVRPDEYIIQLSDAPDDEEYDFKSDWLERYHGYY